MGSFTVRCRSVRNVPLVISTVVRLWPEATGFVHAQRHVLQLMGLQLAVKPSPAPNEPTRRRPTIPRETMRRSLA
jgi:hypothetical protein